MVPPFVFFHAEILHVKWDTKSGRVISHEIETILRNGYLQYETTFSMLGREAPLCCFHMLGFPHIRPKFQSDRKRLGTKRQKVCIFLRQMKGII